MAEEFPRRFGKPLTDAERKARHEALYGKGTPLPERGARVRGEIGSPPDMESLAPAPPPYPPLPRFIVEKLPKLPFEKE